MVPLLAIERLMSRTRVSVHVTGYTSQTDSCHNLFVSEGVTLPSGHDVAGCRRDGRATAEDDQMQIGVVGLGRMGANISRRLMKGGHTSVVWDANQAAIDSLGKDGATTATGLADLVRKLDGSPKAVWVMLPHGKITEDTIDALAGMMGQGDIIIDGGNTF